MKAGDRVRGRTKSDRLFYCGVVVEDVGSTQDIVQIQFDDDRPGKISKVPKIWTVPGDNVELYRIPASEQSHAAEQSPDDVIISEGLSWVGKLGGDLDENTGPRATRLLSFGRSPKVYQSGLVLKKDDSFYPQYIFEPEQAMALGLALVKPTISKVSEHKIRVVLVGGGGFTLTTALRHIYTDCLTIDAVELHAAVIEAAHRSFGLPRSAPGLNVVCADGLQYLGDLETESCTTIFVDVVSTDTEDGAPLEFPSIGFLEDGFLTNTVRRSLKFGGIFVVNVIADAENLEMVARKLRTVFGNVQVLATDPNYYFYSRKGAGDEAEFSARELQDLANDAGLGDLAQDILAEVLETDHYRTEEILIGWLSFDEFVCRLKTERA